MMSPRTPSTTARRLSSVSFLLGALGAGLFLTGCPSKAAMSAGQVGCSENDIHVSDESSGWGTKTWVAECHGRSFFCTDVLGNKTEQVTCKEAVPAASASTASPGCQYDTQCKGARICKAGACVDP